MHGNRGLHGKIGDELLIEACPIGRFFPLQSKDHGQGERGAALLLSDRRQHADAAIFDFY